MEAKKLGPIKYEKGGITSKVLIREKINLTLFAFDKDQELSTHTSGFPALIQVLEGKLKVTIGKEAKILEKNSIVFLPKGKQHAVKAITKAKMLLFLAK